MLLGAFLLGTDEQEVEDGEHGDKRNNLPEGVSAASLTGTGRTHRTSNRRTHEASWGNKGLQP